MTIVTDLLLAVATLAGAASSTLPIDVTFDTVICDGTVAAQRFVRYNYTKKGAVAVDDPDLPFSVVVKSYANDLFDMLNGYEKQMRELQYYVVVFDKPDDAPANKEVEHEKRDGDLPPYSEADLPAIDADKPAFGVDYIKGNRRRLWANDRLRALLHQFFYKAQCEGLSSLDAHRILSGARPRFVVDGPVAGTNELATGVVGERQVTCVTATARLISGEADVEFVEYLSDSYGQSFLVYSVDGDWELNALAELDKRRQMMPDAALPVIWFDRTADSNVKKNLELPMRYVNLTKLYMYISGLDNITPSKSTMAVDDARVASTLAMYMLGGTDYVSKFCRFGRLEASSSSSTIYGPKAMTGVSTTTTKKKKPQQQQQQKEEEAPTKKKKRALKPKKDATVFLKSDYVQCFALEATDDDDARLQPIVKHKELSVYLAARYPTEQRTPALMLDLISEMPRLQWALNYAYGYSDSDLPPRYRCLERAGDGTSRWGWDLQPLVDQQDSSSDRKVIRLERDDPLRQRLLKDPNTEATLFRVVLV